jgi:hypothetical protein
MYTPTSEKASRPENAQRLRSLYLYLAPAGCVNQCGKNIHDIVQHGERFTQSHMNVDSTDPQNASEYGICSICPVSFPPPKTKARRPRLHVLVRHASSSGQGRLDVQILASCIPVSHLGFTQKYPGIQSTVVKTHRTQCQRFSPCSLPRTVCCKCVQHTLDFKTPTHPTTIRSFLRKHDQQVWLWKRQELSSNEHQLFNAIERRDAYNMWVCADGGLRFVQQGVMQRGAVSIGFVGWRSQS